jgi:hypothetical protein
MTAGSYFAIRHEGDFPDGLLRQEGGQIEGLHMSGRWAWHPSLLDKLQDPFVEPVSQTEAAEIARGRGARLEGEAEEQDA